VNPSPPLTDEIFADFLKCPYKAYLKLRGTAGEPSDYQQLKTKLAAEYRLAAREEVLRTRDPTSVIVSPPLLADAIQSRPALILDAPVADADGSCRLDALERAPGGTYTPILFAPQQRVTADERLRLAFGASVLARVQGVQTDSGRIVHGRQFKLSKVSLPTLVGKARDVISQIRAIQESATTPPLLLNRHCAECEFLRSCRATAVAKDDLSLLRGLSPKEIGGLNRRGIFTVTQYSYTFRPGRLKRAARVKDGRHDHSLQALAVRDRTVYVARRPELPGNRISAYFDVEGLPDRGFYYLIGLAWDDGTGVRRSAFWADREADEAAAWGAFLEAVRGFGDDFVLFHYGSYETQFLARMADRHGGDPGLIGRVKARCVNALSAIHARVYFPVHANDLKSVAGCLGFRWSDPDASGLHSVAWRAEWEETASPVAKQRLLTYNQEDCSALARVVAVLRDLAADVPPADDARPGVAGVEDIKVPRGHKFCDTEYVLPDFARVSKCAYFDYQRDKVLVRTSPAVRKAVRRQERHRHPACRVNQVVEYGGADRCPRCGSGDFVSGGYNSRLVVDLKPVGGGLKRWVTRHKGQRYRCRRCGGDWVSDDYLATWGRQGGRTKKYGWALCGWVAYATVALRQTNEGTVAALGDLFGVHIKSSGVGKLRHQAADRYRETYVALLAELRAGPLVHADETWVRTRRCPSKGYVWTFASPDTALYVYSPSREGETLRETLAGFRGVLVSDFYAAYDVLDCPQQKCIIHLLRDLNDDLAKNPFDQELKQLAARFGSLMRSIVETIDRYGLKRHHLSRHKREVDRFYSLEVGAAYGSEPARHYHLRLLKYRDKLFTFLDHDGVPWNNNNAENAIKRFVSRRKGMEGTGAYSEAGLREYLMLLSIYQTLRYRGLSFWKFLLSGETDIAAFTARHH
jgi:predicted RecB family nuclease